MTVSAEAGSEVDPSPAPRDSAEIDWSKWEVSVAFPARWQRECAACRAVVPPGTDARLVTLKASLRDARPLKLVVHERCVPSEVRALAGPKSMADVEAQRR